MRVFRTTLLLFQAFSDPQIAFLVPLLRSGIFSPLKTNLKIKKKKKKKKKGKISHTTTLVAEE
jgi:hypothetical protein